METQTIEQEKQERINLGIQKGLITLLECSPGIIGFIEGACIGAGVSPETKQVLRQISNYALLPYATGCGIVEAKENATYGHNVAKEFCTSAFCGLFKGGFQEAIGKTLGYLGGYILLR